MKLANGRLGTYISDLTGTRVERGIYNPTAGVYGRTKTVFLPEDHKLKKLGVDFFELSSVPSNSKLDSMKHIMAGKIIKEKDADSNINTYQKTLASGSGKKGIQTVRNFIEMIQRHNIKVD